MKLTKKQQDFADYYIELGNAEEAALKAGYSKNYARASAYKLLAIVGVKKYIDERLKQIASERIMTAQEAVELLSSIARAEVTERVVVSTPVGVEEVDKPPDLKTRMQAAREIIKRYPNNDKMLEQQLRKVTAEADIAEVKAEMFKNVTDETTEDKLDELLSKISGELDD